MGEFFPTADEIRAKIRAEQDRPSVWRETNLRMLREFLETIEAAGLKPPPNDGWYLTLGAAGGPYDVIGLMPGPRPYWKATGSGGAKYCDLEDADFLEQMDPEKLQWALMETIRKEGGFWKAGS